MLEIRRILVRQLFPDSVRACALTTQPETADDLVIALYVYALEVIEKTSALRDHLEQAAPRMIILLMGLEMLGQLVDALAE